MFEDILSCKKPKQVKEWGPSYIEIYYFKDGEIYEDFVTISSEELLAALPLFMPRNKSEEEIEHFIERVKYIELINKCLQSQKNLI